MVILQDSSSAKCCATDPSRSGHGAQIVRMMSKLSVQSAYVELDALDVDLIGALRASPRAGVLELSRTLGVARGTVQARLDRLEREGVITGDRKSVVE